MSDYTDTLEYMLACYEPVQGYDFYSELFPNCESKGDDYKDFSHPNAIYLYYDKDMKRLRRRIMLKDTFENDFLEYIYDNESTLCSGLTYRGRANKLDNAQQMNALIFDIDGVGLEELKIMEARWDVEAGKYRSIPKPTFLVLSGSGVHYYYVFDNPIDLYPNIKLQLKSLKYDLTFRIWEYGETSKEEKIQYQSINQSFRMVDSFNNKDIPFRKIIAFRTGERVSVDFLNKYVTDDKNKVDLTRPFKPTKQTLSQAKENYPEWYERVIVNKIKKPKKWNIDEKVNGSDPYALYHWWIRQKNKIVGGHRYYFLMCMAIYASKCNLPRDILKKDMDEIFQEIADIPHKNPLTETDKKIALEAYSKEYYDTSIKEIEYWTSVQIKRNKRNGRSQERHLKIMRDDKADMKAKGISLKNPEGRPIKYRESVVNWKKKHPTGTKAQCSRDLGITRKTVYKWWDSI